MKQRIESAEADTRVEAILTQDTALPLRSSGPLMLGVVRIYSRKVGYLFDDCKEARERISLVSRFYVYLTNLTRVDSFYLGFPTGDR